MIATAESDAYSAEKNVRQIKTNLEKHIRECGPGSKWNMEQYKKAIELVDLAIQNQLDKPNDKYQLKAQSIVSSAQKECEAFETSEAERRLANKNAVKNEKEKRISNGKKMIASECSNIFKRLEAAKNKTFDGATAEKDLNGPLLSNQSLAELASEVKQLVFKVKDEAFYVKSIEQLDKCYENLQSVLSTLESLEHKMTLEAEKRQRIEDETSIDLKRRQTANDIRLANEKAKQEAERQEREALEAESLARASETIAKERMSAIGDDIKGILEKQKLANNADQFGELQLDIAEQKLQELNELNEFEKSLFGDDTSKAAVSSGTSNALKGVSKLKAKRQKRLAAKIELEKKKLRQLEELSKTKFHTEKLHKEQLARARAAEEASRAAAVAKARAEFNEGQDDSEEEQRLRKDARQVLMKYDGDVWEAVRTGNTSMVKKFFLVEGTDRLLNARNFSTGGGRTLLHVASWYGYLDIVKFLLSVGATLDAVDTVCSKITSVMEAARAGRTEICLELIKYGASISLQDAHGDTACHWAARRGWGSLLTSMIQAAEKARSGSTQGVFGIQNYKGDYCLGVVPKDSTVHSLVEKELGVVFTAERGSAVVKPTKGVMKRGNNNNQKSHYDITDPIELEKHLRETALDDTFESVQQPEEVHALNDLGLDLDGFSYKHRR